MERTWEDNAAEFAAMDEGEGWPFARLVACSVEKGVGGRGNAGVSRARNSEKVSANEFAAVAGTSADRVLRYLEGWNNAAKKRWVRAASGLTPADVDTPYPTAPARSWLDEKGGLRLVDTKKVHVGGRPRDSKPEDAITIIDRRGAEAVVEAMTPTQREAVVTAVTKAAPETVARATAKDTKATAAYAAERQAETERRKAELNINTGPTTSPEVKSMDALVASRNAVGDWIKLLHAATIAAHNAVQRWEEVEADLIDTDLVEANTALSDLEGDLLMLKGRIAMHDAVTVEGGSGI